MSLQELKALSRQIRPTSTVPTTKSNHVDIVKLSRNLRDNLYKAKSKMLHNLKQSNTPKDLAMYECLTEIDNDLVTDDAESVSVVPSCSISSASTVSSLDDSPLMPLYTPTSVMNMELFFQSSFWAPKTMPVTQDVTEDQINSWLQRGGFGDHMSPITMATDQELAGKKIHTERCTVQKAN